MQIETDGMTLADRQTIEQVFNYLPSDQKIYNIKVTKNFSGDERTSERCHAAIMDDLGRMLNYDAWCLEPTEMRKMAGNDKTTILTDAIRLGYWKNAKRDPREWVAKTRFVIRGDKV